MLGLLSNSQQSPHTSLKPHDLGFYCPHSYQHSDLSSDKNHQAVLTVFQASLAGISKLFQTSFKGFHIVKQQSLHSWYQFYVLAFFSLGPNIPPTQLKGGRIYFCSCFQRVYSTVSRLQGRNSIMNSLAEEWCSPRCSQKQSRRTCQRRRARESTQGTQIHPEVCFPNPLPQQTFYIPDVSSYRGLHYTLGLIPTALHILLSGTYCQSS